MNKKRVL